MIAKLSLFVKYMLQFVYDFINKKATESAKEKLKEKSNAATKKVQIALTDYDELERLIKSYEATGGFDQVPEKSSDVSRRIKAVSQNSTKPKRSNKSSRRGKN